MLNDFAYSKINKVFKENASRFPGGEVNQKITGNLKYSF